MTTESNPPIEFLPTSFRQCPPTRLISEEEGRKLYLWYITEDEYLRLSKLLRRDFQETGMGGTNVCGLPTPCRGCGKYTEFIDWVWTALARGVHSREFMFKALIEGRQGVETSHDAYCSECGLLAARTGDNREGGKPDIFQAGPLERFTYPSFDGTKVGKPERSRKPVESEPSVTWGKWWLDNTGKPLVAKYGDKVSDSE
ncbi:hypothetical protein D9757_009188 [Collybiopsis confluens]|uniref:Uncharacterized protein n=1 Tax=Collybiopsis confluens TaxID=2823264 RepID=A0A8H5HAC1_9AGAR|nr:hypothetical protein D9757_009188 [Collybiopsis confluens]